MGRVRHLEGGGDEAFEVHGRADHCDPAGTGSGIEDGGCLSQAQISSATFYKWKAKYGGLDVSEARRLKVLSDENAKLKKLLAETPLGYRQKHHAPVRGQPPTIEGSCDFLGVDGWKREWLNRIIGHGGRGVRC